MSRALFAKLVEQKNSFKGTAVEKGRPYGPYGGFEGEFVSRRFGKLKGFHSWKEMLDRNQEPNGEIELTFIPNDLTDPRIRDAYEDRGNEFKIYGRAEVGMSNSFGGGNLKLSPEEEKLFDEKEKGMNSASRK